MEVYAAMVDCLDQGVGRIVEALRETGEFENTLILFLADNGGCAENMGRGEKMKQTHVDPTLRRPMEPGSLQRNMVPAFTRDGRPLRQGRGVMPGPADTYLGYGLSWANASNTPFREYKHWVHEGGISSPLIAHWPRGIVRNNTPQRRSNSQGALVDTPAHLIDLMATCVEVADAEYPTQFAGQAIQPMEGVSLAPAFRGEPLERKNPIFWEHEGNRAVRQGAWKLVAKHKGDWELYNIEKDRTELNNVAERHPDRVAALARLWTRWAERAGVQPWPVANRKSR
jgi:arylsulfatase